jgi:hypothetical protein
VAFFDEMAANPGRLLTALPRLATTRLAGRPVTLQLPGGSVDLTVLAVDLVDVKAEATTDDIIDAAFEWGEAVRRGMADPFRFSWDAMGAFATVADRLLGSGPVRLVRGEVDLASAGSAKLVDVEGDELRTAAIDITCTRIIGRLGPTSSIVVHDIGIVAHVAADAVPAWLARAGVDVPADAVLRLADDGTIRVCHRRAARVGEVVIEARLEADGLVLVADSAVVLGRRVPLPARWRRRWVADPGRVRPGLCLDGVEISSTEIRLEASLAEWVQPVTVAQLDDLVTRMATDAGGRLPVPIIRQGQAPGTPDRRTAGPASGSR